MKPFAAIARGAGLGFTRDKVYNWTHVQGQMYQTTDDHGNERFTAFPHTFSTLLRHEEGFGLFERVDVHLYRTEILFEAVHDDRMLETATQLLAGEVAKYGASNASVDDCLKLAKELLVKATKSL